MRRLGDEQQKGLHEVYSLDKRTGARVPFSVFEGTIADLGREINRAIEELGADSWVSAECLWEE